MPKSKVPKKRMFRDFSRQDKKYIKRNNLKRLKQMRQKVRSQWEISFSDLEFLLWGYDLQFFTIDYAAQDLEMNKTNLSNRVIYPLQKAGYIYKHFDKLTPSDTYEDHLFRDETKYNYRVRYGLTQKARLLVQRFYRELMGEL
jgi:hypothetical protein|tara:strand:- start:1375 stop:1803 length:429 start_codon:yes stop_codon:yes gene_type:complete